MEDLPSSPDTASPAFANPGQEWEELPPPLPPIGILANLSDRSLANLASFGRYEKFSQDSVLITEGAPQDRFYILVSGKLAISALASGKELLLSTAEPGECIGEVCLLEPGQASASVKVLETSMLWSMDLEDLRSYLAQHAGGGGALLMGMASCLSQRLRHANELIAQHQMAPVEALPLNYEPAITAGNTPAPIGFFDRLKKSINPSEKKVRISTEIKL